jgi:pimeloyl-ACP methyl ester carboxylesterase
LGKEIFIQHDGRSLGVYACGDPDGMPVFYFHGFPGSRLEVRLAADAARQRRLRLIGIDRPGYGRSDAKPGRRLTDWVGDVSAVADQMGIGRFTVLGASGGAPYAAACAYCIPQRLRCAGIACGLGPVDGDGALAPMNWINRWGLRLARRSPALTAVVFAPVAFGLRHLPGALLTAMAHRAAEPDRRVMHRSAIARILRLSFRESMRRGPAGALSDLAIYANPWDFPLEAIPIPVYLWHGENDTIVPAAMGRSVAARIPNCRARFYAGEGHFSLSAHRMNEILDRLSP